MSFYCSFEITSVRGGLFGRTANEWVSANECRPDRLMRKWSANFWRKSVPRIPERRLRWWWTMPVTSEADWLWKWQTRSTWSSSIFQPIPPTLISLNVSGVSSKPDASGTNTSQTSRCLPAPSMSSLTRWMEKTGNISKHWWQRIFRSYRIRKFDAEKYKQTREAWEIEAANPAPAEKKPRAPPAKSEGT